MRSTGGQPLEPPRSNANEHFFTARPAEKREQRVGLTPYMPCQSYDEEGKVHLDICFPEPAETDSREFAWIWTGFQCTRTLLAGPAAVPHRNSGKRQGILGKERAHAPERMGRHEAR